MTSLPGLASVWDDVIGQPSAVEHLRRVAADPVHAFLFVGPPGSTKHEARAAFAAAVLAGGDDPGGRDARLARSGTHPDVREVERAGPYITKPQADDIIRWAALAPVEGERKVLVLLHEFHLVQPDAAAALLKTIEEPPASTTFVVLADFVPPELVTIASRCVRVDFRTISDDVLAARLRADGTDAATVELVVAAARGNLTRARLLAHDAALVERQRAFAELPLHLDGTGTTAMKAVDDLLTQIDAAGSPLIARQAVEVAALDARSEQFGERGSGRKPLEDRHKRELRRHRTDELRSGLAVLAGAYRDMLIAGDSHRPDALIDAVTRIHDAIEALERNPNEQLLLQSLVWSLPVDSAHAS